MAALKTFRQYRHVHSRNIEFQYSYERVLCVFAYAADEGQLTVNGRLTFYTDD